MNRISIKTYLEKINPIVSLIVLLICLWAAIRDEGTSYHYLEAGKFAFPSKELNQEVIDTMKEMGIDFMVGPSWTIDAPYRETIAEVNKYRQEGVITVEMEAAAIFAVSRYRGAAASALFTISDYLGEEDWKPEFHLTKDHLVQVFEIA